MSAPSQHPLVFPVTGVAPGLAGWEQSVPRYQTPQAHALERRYTSTSTSTLFKFGNIAKDTLGLACS